MSITCLIRPAVTFVRVAWSVVMRSAQAQWWQVFFDSLVAMGREVCQVWVLGAPIVQPPAQDPKPAFVLWAKTFVALSFNIADCDDVL